MTVITYETVTIGDERAQEFPPLTRTMFVRYAGASGDFNPMHHDDTIATQVGNPSVFGHGMLTMGLAARVLKDWFGPEAIRRLQVRFSKQVWPGDVLTCRATVTGKRAEAGEQLVDLDLVVENQNGDKAITGAATVAVGAQAMGLLDGRVAVVTGAGRGIGREFALCFAREGARVVVNDVGATLAGDGSGDGDDPAAEVCKEIEALGSEGVPSHDSVTDFDGARRIVGTAVDAFGTVDILVNNAGIVRDKTLLKMDEPDFDAVIAVHLKGTFNCTRHAAEVMKDRGYGRIVNITSSAGLRGNFGQTNYGAAKAGIMGMTFVWSMELGRYGITVNAVAPSGATRMTAGLYERAGTAPPPEEDPALNAPLVAFLASEQAGHVNGQVLGRTEYAYTLFQHPKQIAWMWNEGGWTPAAVADRFDKGLGQHLQAVGMVMPKSMQK